MCETEKLSDVQREQVIGLIQSQAWGDIDRHLVAMEDTLRLAMEATAEYLHIWENDDAGERRYGDEFSVDEDDTEAMSNEWRLAYVAAARRQDTWVAALLHPRTAQDGTVAPSTKSLPSCLSG